MTAAVGKLRSRVGSEKLGPGAPDGVEGEFVGSDITPILYSTGYLLSSHLHPVSPSKGAPDVA